MLPQELRERVDEFLSPDSLLPPSLVETSRLLRRPALDLLLLHDDDAPPTSCSATTGRTPTLCTMARPG